MPRRAAQASGSLEPTIMLVGADSAFEPALRAALARHRVYVETTTPESVAETVIAAAPDLVLVGLGFPKQEKLIEQLRLAWPNAWYLACGGGIPMAAGVNRRASPLVQRLGLEWVHRLMLEPRRLARRYLRDDLPFAIELLARTTMHRVTR